MSDLHHSCAIASLYMKQLIMDTPGDGDEMNEENRPGEEGDAEVNPDDSGS